MGSRAVAVRHQVPGGPGEESSDVDTSGDTGRGRNGHTMPDGLPLLAGARHSHGQASRTGFPDDDRSGLFPTDEQARALCADMFAGDPVAERFAAEVMCGETGREHGRRLLDTARRDGIDSVPDAPMAMRELFDEFETVPDWVRPELVERGAAVWRRWGTVLFGFAGAETLEMYTESAVATPLSLAGGYAGDSALRRFLETCRFWMDVSQPGALLSPGSPGWATALKVRIMHVSVRAGVQRHPEWEIERWGLPISQTYQLLTLIAGSTIPGRGCGRWATRRPPRSSGRPCISRSTWDIFCAFG